ncbi:hypothetical protein N7528_009223 [Penicillium herquei]|nr:hypothetical protein N7528_009223 [Penicillium herquei]
MSELPSPAANSSSIDKVLQQIKDNIAGAVPKTDLPQDDGITFYVEDQNGIRAFEGAPLEDKVPQLVALLKLGEGLTWSLAHFSQPRPIRNKFSRMWLVPLSDNAIITPGGPLKKGKSPE